MKHGPTDEDRELFRAAVRGAKPMHSGERQPPQAPKPPPRPRQREADDRAVLEEMMRGPLTETGDELAWRSHGIQETTFRKLRRGTYRIDDELDLHGLTVAQAGSELSAFLADCRRRSLRCVRIIHGKGLRSKGDGPVLKQYVDQSLRRRRDVLAFASARPRDGGTGAVYVLLRKN